jgi:hypothetical protein
VSSMRPLHRVITPSRGRHGGRVRPSLSGRGLLRDLENRHRTAQVNLPPGPSAWALVLVSRSMTAVVNHTHSMISSQARVSTTNRPCRGDPPSRCARGYRSGKMTQDPRGRGSMSRAPMRLKAQPTHSGASRKTNRRGHRPRAQVRHREETRSIGALIIEN